MSCSVFRDIDEDLYTKSGSSLSQQNDEEGLNSEENLIIMVNDKSGKVTVDEKKLHNLITSEKSNTSVSILRVSSPTPSMQEEMDEEEFQEEQSNEEIQDSDETPGEEDLDTPVIPKKKPSLPRVSITVEGYYSSEEAKDFVAEVLSLAGVDNPLSIDYEFQRYVIQNDHCYTKFTAIPTPKTIATQSTKQVEATSTNNDKNVKESTLTQRSQRAIKATTRSAESNELEKSEEKSAGPEVDTQKENDNETFDESDFEFESEESETSTEDNDNDSDLDFDVNRSSRTNKKSKRKRKFPKSKAILKYGNKKITNKKRQSTRSVDSEEDTEAKEDRSHHKKTPVVEKKVIQQRKVVSKGKQPPVETKESNVSNVVTPTTTVTATTSAKKDHNNKKKDVTDVLYNDMSSLFSKPDKIKKVDGKVSQGNVKYKPGPSTAESEQLDLIDALVQKELQQTSDVETNDLPGIVKMFESNQDQNDLTDNALLETLGESLPEDFLHTVAELAENKEIQEIIDKQVLGVNVDQPQMPQTPPTIITPNTTPKPSTVVSTPIHVHATRNLMQKANATPSITEARKHPLKIQRSDGRIIVLPPIEVPTTRGAKKRLTQSESDTNKTGADKTSNDTSNTTNITATAIKSEIQKETPSTPVVAAKIKKSLSKDEKSESSKARSSREKSTSRRNSSNRNSVESADTATLSSKKRKRAITNPAVLAVLNNERANSESGDSWNSEDDPDRLWCICRQPHNNRFMICCDVCEDWFHGKCVNITKAQGNQMEAEGKEWTCPNCLKKKEEKEQPRITAFLNESNERKKPTKSTFPTSSASKKKLCIVCKKDSRPGSIYCSDDCITKHAEDALVSNKIVESSSKHTFSGEIDFDKHIQTSKIVKNKEEHVIVYEESTNRSLTGDKAPTAQNLKQFLKDNPTFQCVTPGNAQMNAIMAKKRQLKQVEAKLKEQSEMDKASSSSTPKSDQKIQSKLKFSTTDKKLTITKSKDSHQHQHHDRKSTSSVKSPPPQTSSHSRHSSKPSPTHEKKTPTSKQHQSSTSHSGKKDSRDDDIIRQKSKEGLQAALEERMATIKDSKVPKLTSDEIKEFAENVEKELYLLFNKECSQKYKNKYRSLHYNIKDTKNMTLFKKICEKNIKPHRLVRMEAAELASQELAQWRENENKHQLEMIKKSELELLAASKNFVLKTHKGEEVLESKAIDRVELDPNMAVEDVVKVLNSNTHQHKEHSDSAYIKSYSHKSNEKEETHSHHSSDKDKKHHHSSRSSSRHHERSKSRSKHKRKHSRDRSESRSHHESKKSRHNDKTKTKEKEKSPERKKDVVIEKERILLDNDQPTPTQEDFNLIDKILEGSQIKLPRPGVQLPSTSATSDQNSDQEPSSTVNISTPPQLIEPETIKQQQQPEPIWKGTLNMADVASFRVQMQPVTGDAKSVMKYMTPTLNVVGRIAAQSVWDYLYKLKKSPNKELIVVRFCSPDDETNFLTLYDYYDSRKRLGVIESTSTVVKDFYLYPLPAAKDLPKILQSNKGDVFPEGKNKPDMLIGIIVKINHAEKQLRSKPILPPIITKKSLENIDPSFSLNDEDSIIRLPKSSSSKLLMMGLPKTTSEDDEPYEPGDSDENDVSSSSVTVTTTTSVTIKQKSKVTDEEAAKLDELNREIQARKMEIAGMLNTDPDSLDEPYSPSRPVSPPTDSTSAQSSVLPGLDKIAIPSNLSEILASIKNVVPGQLNKNNDDDEEYDPTAVTATGITFYQSTSTYKPSSYTETTEISVTERPSGEISEILHGEKRKLGDADIDLRFDLPSNIPNTSSMEEEEEEYQDCFEIPDEEGVKRPRLSEQTLDSTLEPGTGSRDLDMRKLEK